MDGKFIDQTSIERRRKRPKIRYYLGFTKYSIVRKVLERFSDWQECESEEGDWDIIWIDNALTPERLAKMKHYQRVNHFLGTYSITRSVRSDLSVIHAFIYILRHISFKMVLLRKNFLGRNLSKMKKIFPDAFKFFPSTWILPTDLSEFKQQFKGKRDKTFIIKPDAGSQGKGIFLIRKFEELKFLFYETYIAQTYINKPFLIDGYKFDLRMYVLITGCNPLRIFVHRDGLIRLATELYETPTTNNLSTSLMHLTNYSLNKMSNMFKNSSNPEDPNLGHKRSMRHFFERLYEQGYDITKVNEEIEDLIIKTLATIQPSMAHSYSTCQPDELSNSMCFEILGFDIMLDYKLKPWLLEVNHSPSFSIDSQVDLAVKFPVIYDAIMLLNLKGEDKTRYKTKLRSRILNRLRNKTNTQSKEEKLKTRRKLAYEFHFQRNLWEESNTGGYRKIYPRETSEKYDPYFSTAASLWEALTGTSKKKVECNNTNPKNEEKPQVKEKKNKTNLERYRVKSYCNEAINKSKINLETYGDKAHNTEGLSNYKNYIGEDCEVDEILEFSNGSQNFQKELDNTMLLRDNSSHKYESRINDELNYFKPIGKKPIMLFDAFQPKIKRSSLILIDKTALKKDLNCSNKVMPSPCGKYNNQSDLKLPFGSSFIINKMPIL